jgi:hypothetical protein
VRARQAELEDRKWAEEPLTLCIWASNQGKTIQWRRTVQKGMIVKEDCLRQEKQEEKQSVLKSTGSPVLSTNQQNISPCLES